MGDRAEHFIEYHIETYKKVYSDQSNFDIAYENLKDKYPLAQHGYRDYFKGIDKYELTLKQKLEIKKSGYKGAKQ